jgi:3-hydroxybutyryl-CoA dehydrogenase
MSNSEVSRVVVIGAGQMGAGIAEVCAAAGIEVSLTDVSEARAAEGKARIERNLGRLAEKGKTTLEANRALLARITPAGTGAFATADVAVEAASEERGLKAEVLAAASAALPERALLLTNTSSISITWLAARTSRPERVAGMHFMNPVPRMQLVEVVRGLQTSDETLASVVALAQRLGKTVIRSEDRPGFIVNRMLIPFLNEACFALEEGLGSAPDIDAGARLGLNHPLGPLELADLIGLDTVLFIAEILHRDLGDDKYRPASLLRNLVAAGWFGKKSGRGFYRYDAQGNRLEPTMDSWSTA